MWIWLYSSTFFKEELLHISGTCSIWGKRPDCHPTNSIKALKWENKALTLTSGLPYPYFIHSDTPLFVRSPMLAPYKMHTTQATILNAVSVAHIKYFSWQQNLHKPNTKLELTFFHKETTKTGHWKFWNYNNTLPLTRTRIASLSDIFPIPFCATHEYVP